MIPIDPRPVGCSVVEGKDITTVKVERLANAAERCWEAIMARDLPAFAKAYKDSFNAQTAMFPAMIQGSVEQHIARYAQCPEVLAWKMPGAGGGGYLACVVTDVNQFCNAHPEAFAIRIRRSGM